MTNRISRGKNTVLVTKSAPKSRRLANQGNRRRHCRIEAAPPKWIQIEPFVSPVIKIGIAEIVRALLAHVLRHL